MTSTSPTAASRRPTSRRSAPAATASRSSTAPAPRSATSSSTSRRSRWTTSRSARPRAAIDRQAITDTIYKGTATPLYSTVPAAFPGAKESFKDAFGDPDPAKAKAILDEAGVSTPVTLDGWYTPTHYGPVEADLWNEIKRQLEESGLFKVNLDSTEWDQYKEEAFEQGHVLLLRPRLVPGLPGRRQLPVAVHARRRLLRQRLLQQGGQRRARRGDRAPRTRPRARRSSASSRTRKPRTYR